MSVANRTLHEHLNTRLNLRNQLKMTLATLIKYKESPEWEVPAWEQVIVSLSTLSETNRTQYTHTLMTKIKLEGTPAAQAEYFIMSMSQPGTTVGEVATACQATGLNDMATALLIDR